MGFSLCAVLGSTLVWTVEAMRKQKAQLGAIGFDQDLSELDGVRNWSELIQRLVEISHRRSRVLTQLRQALLEGDVDKVLKHASDLCGLEAAEIKAGNK